MDSGHSQGTLNRGTANIGSGDITPKDWRHLYVPLRVLGRGGMGSVWAARDRRDGLTVAVKILADALADDDAMRGRLRREATVAAGIRHPNLIRILEAALDASPPALVMEYVEGRSLRDALRTERPFPGEGALAVVEALAGALAALHAEGVVHRDVKPDNVMIRPDGSPVLLDLGLVRRMDGTALTATGTILGTPAYLAPEVCRGERPGPPADVFALGVLLAELLSPVDLFPAAGPALMRCVTERAAGKAAVPLSDTIQAPLRSLVETLTAPRLADRPRDGAEAVTTIGAARRRLTSGTVPSASTRTTRAARPPAAGQAPPTRAVAVRAPASPRRRLPLILTAALILTVVYIVRNRLAEVAPVQVRKPPTATAASVAAFERALDHLANAPSRATLGPLRRAAGDLDPDAARRGIAGFLGGCFPDRDVTLVTIERFRRGVALLPLLVELLHDLDRDRPAGVRSVDVDVGMALWRFASEVGKQTVDHNKAFTSAISGLLPGASPELRSALETARVLEQDLRDALAGLIRRTSVDGRHMGAHLRIPWLVLRCKTNPRDHVFGDAKALSSSLPTDGDPDARDDLRALIEYIGIDCAATHEGLDPALRRSDPLFTELPRWSRDRWVPSCASVAAERSMVLGKVFLTSMGRHGEQGADADSFIRTFLPRLSRRFQRGDLTAFLDHQAHTGAIPTTTHARLIASAHEVEAESPASNHPALLHEPAFRTRTLAGVLQTEAPDVAVVTLTLVIDDEDAATSALEGVATHPSSEGSGWPIRLALPISTPPGWRRASLDVAWPAQARIRVWSAIVTVQEPSTTTRALALRDALADLVAAPSPTTLEPVLSAIAGHADPESSLAALAGILDPPDDTELRRAIALIPTVAAAAATTLREHPDPVTHGDMVFVTRFDEFVKTTKKTIDVLRKRATRDLRLPGNPASVSIPAALTLERELEAALRRALAAVQSEARQPIPALHHLAVVLALDLEKAAPSLEALRSLASSGGAAAGTPTHALGAWARKTLVEVLLDLGRTDEATRLASEMVASIGPRAAYWTPGHCPLDVAATTDAVALVVANSLSEARPLPEPLLVSLLRSLPWTHQREQLLQRLGPRPVLNDAFARAHDRRPSHPYPTVHELRHLDAARAEFKVGGLGNLVLDWEATLFVDGRAVATAKPDQDPGLASGTLRLAAPAAPAPGWRRVSVVGRMRNVAQDKAFTLVERWLPVMPEEP